MPQSNTQDPSKPLKGWRMTITNPDGTIQSDIMKLKPDTKENVK